MGVAAPVSPASPMSPMPPSLPDPPPPTTFHPAQTVATPTHVPVPDVPLHPPAPVDPGPAYLAAPPAPPTASTPVAPVGPLPTYGSDIRPVAATTPAAPTTPAVAAPAAPTSAPANAPGHQPAVVRQPPLGPTQSPVPVGIQSVTAVASGAAAGHASTQAAARSRLHRMLHAVACQEPRLRWAIGDHNDHTTLLVTDLAFGWVPPSIDIPTGITLLTPAQRHGDIQALLGDATLKVSYSPGQQTAEETVPISPRARDGMTVDELGWELGQATRWRDGLPRLAHTLAVAASRGTGVSPNEIDLLHEHLTATKDRVLTAYPAKRDTAGIENWQLLATIDALIGGERAEACYHFAWFQAMSRVGGPQR